MFRVPSVGPGIWPGLGPWWVVSGPPRFDGVDGGFGWTRRLVLLPVALDRDEREHEGQGGEDERLDGVEQHLEGEHRHRDDREGQGGEHAQGDLAAVDVAEESHRQRDGLHELEQELDQAHEQGDDPAPMPFRNSPNGKNLPR